MLNPCQLMAACMFKVAAACLVHVQSEFEDKNLYEKNKNPSSNFPGFKKLNGKEVERNAARIIFLLIRPKYPLLFLEKSK